MISKSFITKTLFSIAQMIGAKLSKSLEQKSLFTTVGTPLISEGYGNFWQFASGAYIQRSSGDTIDVLNP